MSGAVNIMAKLTVAFVLTAATTACSPAPSQHAGSNLPIAGPVLAPTLAKGEVALEEDGGTFIVPVLVNDAITLKFTLDSGAADVSIPADVVSTLVRAGTISNDDFIGKRDYVLADGSVVPSAVFRIRSLKIGTLVMQNVTGSVADTKGQLLLGQSFLSRLGSWSIDNQRHVLLVNLPTPYDVQPQPDAIAAGAINGQDQSTPSAPPEAPIVASTGPRYNSGLDAYNRNDYTSAFALWRPLADQGDAVAQQSIADLYRAGLGVTQDRASALYWYRKAADQGLSNGQIGVGVIYENGEGVPQDYAVAASWYRRAVGASATAQAHLKKLCAEHPFTVGCPYP